MRTTFAKIAAFIFVILAAATGWVLLNPVTLPHSKTVHAQDETWTIPYRKPIDVNGLLYTIAQNRLWGDVGQVEPSNLKSLTPPDWRITGSFSVEKESYVLLSIDNEPLQQLKPGDKLPGGAKILNIFPERICILLNGKKLSLKTYKE
jgi:hypothetical protein